MTVKNYVLDINKTSLQHPSIVLRQDDYNIYTINISVTENGTPVNLGSYTLNFLGITPAGAKIIDSKNFITNAGDLKNGKFSYRFPKEAAGSKGVYDVAYFRLSTTSGATSTIDLNLRVLGGIDLTADEVKDYITVDDTLRNTLVSEVFKRVDAKVDEHLATVKKGDKGDTGPAGKDGYMPIIGGRNLVLGTSEQVVQAKDWNMEVANIKYDKSRGNFVTASVMINNADHASVLGKGSAFIVLEPLDQSGKILSTIYGKSVLYNADGLSWASTTLDDNTASVRVRIRMNNMNGNAFYSRLKVERGNVPTDWTPAPEDLSIGGRNLLMDTGRSFTGVGNNSTNGDLHTQSGKYYLAGSKKVSDIYNHYGPSGYLTLSFDWVASGDTISGQFNSEWNSAPWVGLGDHYDGAIKPSNTNTSGHYEATVPLNASGYSTSNSVFIRFRQDNLQGNVTISNVKLEAGNVATDWTPAPEDVPSNDAQLVHKTGNETVTGDKSLVGNTALATTTILAGNYGLRVTSSGVQKTTDGKTWVSANI